MPVREPEHCRPEAYALFAEQVPFLETGPGLLHAAIAVSLHGMPEAAPARVLSEIERFATRVRERSASGSVDSLLAHLHALLFDELGFRGDDEDYYAPENSYLPAVLERRRGLPILLSLLYKAVGEAAGLTVVGVNAPAHFLVGVEAEDGGRMLVDPFFGGAVLSREDAFERMEQMAGTPLPRTDDLLAPATHRQWLVRILANLRTAYARRGRDGDVRAMVELAALL